MRKLKIVRQLNQLDCGVAAFAMIYNYLNRSRYSIGSFYQYFQLTEFGISLLDIEEIAKKLQLNAKTYSASFEEFWDKKLKKPLIILIKKNKINHFVVYKRKNKTHITILDPSVGEMKVSKTSFAKTWTKYFIYVEKTKVKSKHKEFYLFFEILKINPKLFLSLLSITLLLSTFSLSLLIINKKLFDLILATNYLSLILLFGVISSLVIFAIFLWIKKIIQIHYINIIKYNFTKRGSNKINITSSSIIGFLGDSHYYRKYEQCVEVGSYYVLNQIQIIDSCFNFILINLIVQNYFFLILSLFYGLLAFFTRYIFLVRNSTWKNNYLRQFDKTIKTRNDFVTSLNWLQQNLSILKKDIYLKEYENLLKTNFYFEGRNSFLTNIHFILKQIFLLIVLIFSAMMINVQKIDYSEFYLLTNVIPILMQDLEVIWFNLATIKNLSPLIEETKEFINFESKKVWLQEFQNFSLENYQSFDEKTQILNFNFSSLFQEIEISKTNANTLYLNLTTFVNYHEGFIKINDRNIKEYNQLSLLQNLAFINYNVDFHSSLLVIDILSCNYLSKESWIKEVKSDEIINLLMSFDISLTTNINKLNKNKLLVVLIIANMISSKKGVIIWNSELLTPKTKDWVRKQAETLKIKTILLKSTML